MGGLSRPAPPIFPQPGCHAGGGELETNDSPPRALPARTILFAHLFGNLALLAQKPSPRLAQSVKSLPLRASNKMDMVCCPPAKG
jgi:hypothetical protein